MTCTAEPGCRNQRRHARPGRAVLQRCPRPAAYPDGAEKFGCGRPESRISGGSTEIFQPERSFTLREDWKIEYSRRQCGYTGQRSGSGPEFAAPPGFGTDRRFDGGSWQVKQNQKFDLSGNIICKSDVSAVGCAHASSDQNYFYNSTRPHAVTHAGSRTFAYDANGNATIERDNGTLDRTFAYTTYDKLRRVARGNRHVEFHYGADRSRTLKIERTGNTVTRRTHYVGNVEVVYEGAFPGANAGEFRRYIGGVAIATYFRISGVERVRSVHTDHLGSTTAIAEENGWIETWQGFDAWGQRRNGENWDSDWKQWTLGLAPPPWAQTILDITPRGFTGHEHVDEMGIIHMNGRIYDAHLGRFLQADPFVEDSTTLNRYTYVHNNPLSLTDPSGFFSLGKFVRTVASVAISVAAAKLTLGFGFTAKGFLTAVLGGAAAGGVAAGNIEGALWGAFSGAVFFGIGAGFDQLAGTQSTGVFGTGLRKSQFALQSVSHGLAGGTIAEMQGGKFGHGFISAGVSKAATPGVGANIDGTFQQGFVMAIVGGTTSEISGGKFSNGAVTAAMAFSFGQIGNQGRETTPDFSEMSNEEVTAWLRENASRLGIDIPDGVDVVYTDQHTGFFNTPFGITRVNCEDPLCGGRLDEPTKGVQLGNRIELFPSAFTSGPTSVALQSDRGFSILSIDATRVESAIITLGHEAAHARGIDVPPAVHPLGIHPNAEQAGLDALRSFRELRGGR